MNGKGRQTSWLHDTVCHNYYAYNMYIRGTVLCVHLHVHVLHMYCTCTHVQRREERESKKTLIFVWLYMYHVQQHYNVVHVSVIKCNSP